MLKLADMEMMHQWLCDHDEYRRHSRLIDDHLRQYRDEYVNMLNMDLDHCNQLVDDQQNRLKGDLSNLNGRKQI